MCAVLVATVLTFARIVSTHDSLTPEAELLLVGGGERGSSMAELISLPTGRSTRLFPYPLAITQATGQLMANGSAAVVCGGLGLPRGAHHAECFAINTTDLASSHWSSVASMNIGRRGASSVLLGNGSLWVLGGDVSPSALTDTTEMLSSVAAPAFSMGPRLPIRMAQHCAVQIDDDTILIAGGRQSSATYSQAFRRSWTFDVRSGTWTVRGLLSVARFAHSCALFTDAAGRRVVGAVGGRSSIGVMSNAPDLEKMETFDVETGRWTLRNQPLPYLGQAAVWSSALVATHNALLLAGGFLVPEGEGGRSVFQYQDPFGFRLLEGVKLPEAAFGHVAIVLTEASSSQEATETEFNASLPSAQLVVVGSDDVEISPGESLNLDANQVTREESTYPLLVTGATGQQWDDGVVVCGGYDLDADEPTELCYHYDSSSKEWHQFPSLELGRDGAASAVVGDRLLVLGGKSAFRIESSVEVFDGERWKSGPAMPFGLEGHCAVALNQEHVLIAGGRQWEEEFVGRLQSRHVYLLNVTSRTWTELPPLSERRIGHACGVFALNNGTKVVVVAGGVTGDMQTSQVTRIELFNIETVGGHPETGLFGASIFNIWDGTKERLFLLGGADLAGDVYRSIYEYNEHFGFYDIGVVLGRGRYNVAAVPVNSSNGIH